MKRRTSYVAIGLVALFTANAVAHAGAAEITLLSANALEPALNQLLPEFETASGHTVAVTYGSLGAITDRVQKDETFDLVTVSPQQWDSLSLGGKIVEDPRIVLARSSLGVFVKKGTPRPDVSSVDALKRALLDAPSITFGDPDQGSPVGVYVVPMLGRLGIANDVKSKLRLKQGGPLVLQAVVNGDAAIGLTQISEILALPDVDLAGPFPPELQNLTTYTTAIPRAARDPAAARSLVDFLSSARALTVFKAKGLGTF